MSRAEAGAAGERAPAAPFPGDSGAAAADGEWGADQAGPRAAAPRRRLSAIRVQALPPPVVADGDA